MEENKNEERRRAFRRKQWEFSKTISMTIVLFSMFIVLYTITMNGILIWNDKMSIRDEVVQTVTIFGGITSAISTIVYGFVCSFRDNSKNRHKVTHLEYGAVENGMHIENVIPQINGGEY